MLFIDNRVEPSFTNMIDNLQYKFTFYRQTDTCVWWPFNERKQKKKKEEEITITSAGKYKQATSYKWNTMYVN